MTSDWVMGSLTFATQNHTLAKQHQIPRPHLSKCASANDIPAVLFLSPIIVIC